MRFYLWLALAALTLVATGAEARPRDDVMSRAFRCAAISDTRQWLDCYYGAAQPARAALGLAPASARQQQLVQSPPPGGAPADRALRDQVMAGSFRCNGVADDRQWLNCYYGAAQPVRAALGLTPAPQAAAGPMPAAPIPAQPGFGIPAKAPPAMETNRVTARMKSYSFNRYHIFTVTLENGQVWHQLSGDTNDAHWTKPASNYVVSITHGFFGSFNLSVKGLAGLYKVRRSQ
jgi:hypothetical protein